MTNWWLLLALFALLLDDDDDDDDGVCSLSQSHRIALRFVVSLEAQARGTKQFNEFSTGGTGTVISEWIDLSALSHGGGDSQQQQVGFGRRMWGWDELNKIFVDARPYENNRRDGDLCRWLAGWQTGRAQKVNKMNGDKKRRRWRRRGRRKAAPDDRQRQPEVCFWLEFETVKSGESLLLMSFKFLMVVGEMGRTGCCWH